ncbi:hypothetical protein ACK1FP_003335, partial [Salmonella enterica]
MKFNCLNIEDRSKPTVIADKVNSFMGYFWRFNSIRCRYTPPDVIWQPFRAALWRGLFYFHSPDIRVNRLPDRGSYDNGQNDNRRIVRRICCHDDLLIP